MLTGLFSRPSSCSIRFRRAIEGASDSKEEISVDAGLSEGGVEAMLLSTVTLNVRYELQGRNYNTNFLRAKSKGRVLVKYLFCSNHTAS
jgi:hypothetical protein